MTEKMMETIESLILLMEQESDLLESISPNAELVSLAKAKLRLTDILETQIASADREHPDWLLETGADAPFTHAIGRLRQTAERNARTLARHMDLSRDLLDAVAAEARRLAGTRQETYGAAGSITRTEGAAPVSVNTRL